jgi:putative ATP-binding cassette transporter
VALPRDARIGYGPQEPYLPLGTLRDALLYPGLDPVPSDQRLAALLAECGLPQLRSRLDQVERWDRILSRGEVQRLAFARLLLHKPNVVILDEATSGLDEVSQGRLMLLLARDLHHATVISVGHRPSLRPFHGRCFALVRAEGGARLVEDGERPGSPETRSDPPALRAVSSFH